MPKYYHIFVRAFPQTLHYLMDLIFIIKPRAEKEAREDEEVDIREPHGLPAVWLCCEFGEPCGNPIWIKDLVTLNPFRGVFSMYHKLCLSGECHPQNPRLGRI